MCYNELVEERKTNIYKDFKGRKNNMTREIRVYEETFQTEATGTYKRTKTAAERRRAKGENRGFSAFVKTVSVMYSNAVKAKREISETFVTLTEVLADKTTREGLFGEDRGRNYCGTDVDYINE